MKYAVMFLILISLAIPQLAAAEASPTLERIRQTGTLHIGFPEDKPPLSFLDKENMPAGYSIDLCTRIAGELKSRLRKPDLGIEFVPVTAADRFQALTDGRIDILCGSTTRTLARAERVDFTQLTFVTGASLLSLEKSDIDGIWDLQGKRVAVMKGTTTLDHLNAVLKGAVTAVSVVRVDSAPAAMKALLAGDVDAFAADQVVLTGLALTHDGPAHFAISDDVFSFEPLALVVRRNDSEFRLIADRVLSRLSRSGEIRSIYKRWFGRFNEDIPPLLDALYILNASPE